MQEHKISLFPSGPIQMPPSKSIAHRAIICASLASGKSRVRNARPSNDMRATISCIQALGARIAAKEDELLIEGGLRLERDQLNCLESGTTLRLLLPIAALLDVPITFSGQGRLMDRPLEPILNALAANGASVSKSGDTLTIQGPLRPGRYVLPGDVSSQFVSGLLLTLPLLGGDSEIQLSSPLESKSYVDLTLDMMARFKISLVKWEKNRYLIAGKQEYKPAEVFVEGDYSQAAFFLASGALGCPCECLGLSPSSRQGDREILKLLENSGAGVKTGPNGGILIVPGEGLLPQIIDVSGIPDLVPPLAALLCFCKGESRIIGAKRLRLKESDRLSAVTAALNGLGAKIEQGKDFLMISGVKSLRGGRVDSANDHRIAMMGAVAAIRSDGPVTIVGSDCVEKSYPDFYHDFEKSPRGGF